MSVTSLVPESRRDEGYRSSQTRGEGSFLQQSCVTGAWFELPELPGVLPREQELGRAFEMSCKAWSCPVCSRRRRAVGVELIGGGVRRARTRGERVRFITLTAPPEGMTLKQLYAAWNRLRTTLRKSGELAQYCAVVELGSASRPQPHLHVLATGRYVPQERLSTLARKAGFGRVADIRAVRDTGDRSAVAYVSKQLAEQVVSYLVKAEATSLAARSAAEGSGKRVQVRPLRLSKGWYPGGSKAAEKVVARQAAAMMGGEEEPLDPGPWYLVVKRLDGELSVMTRPKQVEPITDADAHGASASGATRAEVEASAMTGEGAQEMAA